MKPHFLVEIYVPNALVNNPLFTALRLQWSSAFGGTTRITGGGTYQDQPEEGVTIYRIYVPSTLTRSEVVDYFRDRRDEFERTFPGEEAFLITFSEGHYFI